ncbi:TetR/AcrR family transcriptional regulator [Rossellomorea sp. SC111]|uniref:TetR/AcrR family transcriptional regulator n=1 Tax=Rossellomorea sp. SC111 TaxID=2968985 RepID=UPI00215AE4E2|nr:TetR/AcrR family transcriptional regulator [Rossellomorea sp. SC111]MCR8849271.1 TetR/AcrR family transcriptional regulator [Rossellomorea sp. SC111]
MSPKVSQEHKEQRRSNLLKAAREVFSEHGYENTTMKHVMERAGVSRGGLYQYFENKEDLFEALIEDELMEAVEGSIQEMRKQQGSYWDVLLMSFLGKSKQATNGMDALAPSKLEYFITGRNDERRKEHARKRFLQAYQMTVNIIEEGVKAGEFSPRFEPEVIAKAIISHIDGMAMDHAILDSETIQLKEQTEWLMGYVRWGLGVEE